nr:unnamed protein product [Spirometra erinaceieuropaei]
MSEIRRLVEQRKEEEAREEVMDVTKQDGLGGFYRFMYQQKTVLAPKVEQAETSDAEKDRVATVTAGANTSASSEERSEADSTQIKPVEKGASGDATQPRSRSSRDNSRLRRDGAYHRRRSPDSRHQDESCRRSRSRERAASDRDVGRRELSASPPRRTKTPPGCIRAKPLSITDEDLAAARERYLARKAAGIHAEIASSDDDDDDV